MMGLKLSTRLALAAIGSSENAGPTKVVVVGRDLNIDRGSCRETWVDENDTVSASINRNRSESDATSQLDHTLVHMYYCE